MDAERLQAVGPHVRAELARRRLADFLTALVPGYEKARHAAVLAEHLEALERREIRRLVVTMPPRHGKSLHVSQGLPAWWLGRRPSESVILASYGAELAEAHSRRARGFMTDPRWPFPGVAVSAESAAVGRWHTNSGGGVIAAGVGGGLTGHGANLAIVDDPVKGREEADSATIREHTWRWFAEVLLTRLQPDAAVLLTLTRWHEDDLAGRVLSSPGADDWTVLSFAALAEADDPLGRAEGEALWPEWFPVETLEERRLTLGSRAFSALYMQRPTPDTGGTFQRSWLEGRYATLPEGVRKIQTLDSAFKTGTANDYSVIATWAADGVWFYLVDIWRAKVEFPELVRAVVSEAEEHGPVEIAVEDAAAAQSAIQVLRRETNLPIIAVKATGSKISRAESVSPLFEAGKVLLPEQAPAWLADWIEEHVSFPAGKHDDMVDTTSMALERLRGGSRGHGGVAGSINHARASTRERRAAAHVNPRYSDD